MVPQLRHAGKDFRHARDRSELGKVTEGWRPALLQGILADGDLEWINLEWISVFIDHFAVVALDRADLEEIPVAGLTPPGGIASLVLWFVTQ